MRVLALVPGGIEHQLAFFPVLNQIKEGLAATEVVVVAAPAAKDVYQLSTVVSEVVPYNFQASNSPADWANLLGILRDREFEAVLTLTESWSIGLLLWLSGIPTRVGYGVGANNWFLNQTVPHPAPGAAPYGELLQALKIKGSLAPPMVNVPQRDLTAVEALCRGANLSSGYVVIYPGATATGDTYPTAGWVTILKDFQQRQPDLPLVLLQAPETATAIAAIKETLPSLTVIAPETLGQVAALLAGANLLVTVASYPLALANALGVYALGLGTATTQPAPSENERLVTLTAASGKLADIAPDVVLKKLWNP